MPAEGTKISIFNFQQTIPNKLKVNTLAIADQSKTCSKMLQIKLVSHFQQSTFAIEHLEKLEQVR